MTWRHCVLVCLAVGCGGDGGGTEGSGSPGSSSGAEAGESSGGSSGATPTSGGEGTTAATVDPTTGEPVGEPFTITVLDRQWITGTGGWDTQHKDVEVDLTAGKFEKVLLTIDLESSCYPFEKWDSDPPPQGHNWPAKCDAFDRTMGFIFDPAAADGDPPGFEALRSITPFGGPQHAEADITDWANMHPGVHSLRSYIDSWPDGAGQVSGSEGGWTLSVKLDVVPGTPPKNVVAAISLYQGGVGSDVGQTALPFTLPPETTSAVIEYRVSGHGGANDPSGDCIGPAEEFCKRTHHLFLDAEELQAFQPWRTDCSEFCTIMQTPMFGNYCGENPCGSIQSVNAPRAQWCPGDVVKPLKGPVGIGPGEHTLGFLVDGLFPGGTWTTSLVVYGYAD